jgi:hypothetical protein
LNTFYSNPGQRLYRLLKVYLILAVVGAGSVLVYGFVMWAPGIILSVSAGLVAGFFFILLRASESLYKEPVSTSEAGAEIAKQHGHSEISSLVGDIREEYFRLRERHGSLSAAAWYVFEVTTLIMLSFHQFRFAIAELFRGIFSITRH